MNDKILEELKMQTKLLEKINSKLERVEGYIKENSRLKNDKDNFIYDSLEKLTVGNIAINVNKIVDILQSKKI